MSGRRLGVWRCAGVVLGFGEGGLACHGIRSRFYRGLLNDE